MTKDPMLDKIHNVLSGFTSDGTPLNALVGDKMEYGVTILTAAMLANENLSACMDAEEMVDSAIHYYHIVQERVGYYKQNQVQSLEKMID